MSIEEDREDFGARQAEMTARWYENVKKTHGNVEAYIATRHAAYLDRWKEASRFIKRNSEILDIGGGNIYPMLVDFFKDREFSYSYVDVDPSCVDASRNLAQSLGLKNSVFKHGYNDSLDFEDAKFEAVFSSHCLEHSIDLNSTFSEVNRVLVDRGNLLMAVPFGWESNPEHPYFFGPGEWVSLVSDAGFRIRVAQIGCEYPEYGYDYFISAQKISPPLVSRLNPIDYTKDAFEFISCFDQRINYTGDSVRKDDHVIMQDDSWEIRIQVPEGRAEVLPIFNRHDWSGIAEVSWDGVTVTEDLYSWFTYAQPVRIRKNLNSDSHQVVIKCRGKNPSSRSTQGVLYGVLVR